MSSNRPEGRPYMGRVDFDPDDPDIESKLHTLRFRAQMFGSNVVPLHYKGQPLVVYVGTNHDYQYDADAKIEVSDREK